MINQIINNGLMAIMPSSFDNILKFLEEKSDSDLKSAYFFNQDSQEEERTYQVRGSTAIIDIKGSILKNGRFSFFGYSSVGQDDIKRDIDLALTDKKIKSILLSFDSPGGIATGTKELADYISSIKSKKVYAFADGLCASAAYWLASACNKIYSTETSTVGSIGVLRVHRDTSEAYKNMGIKYTYITGGSEKALGNEETSLSQEDKEKMQASVSKLYDIFKNNVSKNRKKLDLSASNDWAEGKVFLGSEALQLNLIDKIVKNKDEAIALINKESSMDKQELIKNYPEAIETIKNEARAEAEVEILAKIQQEKEETQKSFVTLVEKLAGSEVAEKVKTLASLSLKSEQINTLIPLVEKKEVVHTGFSESESRKNVLDAITAVTPEPLETSGSKHQQQDNLDAIIDKIASM